VEQQPSSGQWTSSGGCDQAWLWNTKPIGLPLAGKMSKITAAETG